MILFWVILIVVVLFILWLIGVFNSLVMAKNRTNEAWADIEVQLKRRYDLIPNLVETVKGYATHERELFEKVTLARTKAMGAQTLKEHGEAENMLTGTLKSLFAVAENYPDLKANQNFLELQRELVDAEDKIQAARRFYNSNVRDFNTKIEIFPNRIVAGWLKFTSRDFFELGENDAAAKEPVKVKF
ncbi:MAG: LemA family protein [Patescibacteria group bacterium]|nr:LemA family protein [Patescibacteria group bacterium]MDD5121405.1 LemA family protein [Patescibacteria group bacterium]MDD5221869.1 LemA family protein [Patescibacteria group bacterium]MDD5395676.1 LemA family protein [Patescibacteria group bacterium]